MNEVLAAIAAQRVLPLITLGDADDALAAADALAEGGLTAYEVTLRTPTSLDVLAALARDRTRLVGAGTVLEPAQVDRAVDCGARFIVSPGLDEEVVARAADRGVPALPGVATASEIQHARRLGLDTVKWFPARQLGGAAGVAAVAAAFPGLRFVPTGGIGAHDVAGYLRQACVLAVGGTWFLDRDVVAARDWPTITSAAEAACRAAGESVPA